MAKMKVSYRVDEKNKAVILNKEVPLTRNEELVVNALKDKGYTLTFKSVARAKAKAKDEGIKRDKAYYKSVLSSEDFKAFEKFDNFFKARAWANGIIKTKEEAKKKKEEEAKTKADNTKTK